MYGVCESDHGQPDCDCSQFCGPTFCRQGELGFEPVNVVFLRLEDVFQEFARDAVARRLAVRDARLRAWMSRSAMALKRQTFTPGREEVIGSPSY